MIVQWPKYGIIVYHEKRRCKIRTQEVGYKLTVQWKFLWFWVNRKQTVFDGTDQFDVIQFAKNYILGGKSSNLE